MSPSMHSARSLTNTLSPSCTSQSFLNTSESLPHRAASMKDVSNSLRTARPSAYPKKKPSPYGISKSRKHTQSPLCPAQAVVRKSPRGAKAEHAVQRQREAQIYALRREGIYLEEEYRDEIHEYMHAMEVSRHRRRLPAKRLSLFVSPSGIPCRLSRLWINNQR